MAKRAAKGSRPALGPRPTVVKPAAEPAAKPAVKPAAKAAPAPGIHRKLVAFDTETWQAIDLLGRDAFMTFQELADEAFRDLLRKHGRPVELRDQLKRSAKVAAARRPGDDK